MKIKATIPRSLVVWKWLVVSGFIVLVEDEISSVQNNNNVNCPLMMTRYFSDSGR